MIRWTEKAQRAAYDPPYCAAPAYETDLEPENCLGCVVEQLDAAIATQAESDPWLRFILGRAQGEIPDVPEGETVVEIADGYLSYMLPQRDAARLQPPRDGCVRQWWSVPMPARMPGKDV